MPKNAGKLHVVNSYISFHAICCMHAIDRKMKKITQFHRMRMNTWRLLSAIKRHQKMAWSSCIKLYLCYQLQQYTHFGENITKIVYDSNPPLGRNRQKLHYSWNRVAIPITIPRRLGFLCHFKYGKIELKFFFFVATADCWFVSFINTFITGMHKSNGFLRKQLHSSKSFTWGSNPRGTNSDHCI